MHEGSINMIPVNLATKNTFLTWNKNIAFAINECIHKVDEISHGFMNSASEHS